MSHTTSDSDDRVLSRDQTDSPLMDEGGNLVQGVLLKKGPWTSAEDAILIDYVKKHGEGNWNAVQKNSGLFRCGKSCRLRWANHLRPNLKKGAFTQEEEQLIVELHAKMGNKWARMAAHLPGRTDNEIKNYWNTRIKRRQRAGLPLYPPEVSFQALQESQNQNIGAINNGDTGHQDILQTNGYEIPDVVFDSLKANQGVLPYVPELPDISGSNMLMKGLGSPFCSFMPSTIHRQKRLRDSVGLFSGYSGRVKNEFPSFDQFQNDSPEKMARTFGLPFPLEPDPTTKGPESFGVIQGSQTLSNGNFSASKPTSGAVKLELPSLQYPETDLSSWGASSPQQPLLETVDSFIQSPPPTGTVESDCPSPRNSGLLDALLHEAKTLSNAKNHSSDKSSNSSSVTPADIADSCTLNICETEWEDYGDALSPLGHSATSLFNECTPLSTSGSSLDEQAPVEPYVGCKVKSEPVDQTWTPDRGKESTNLYDISQADALLSSDWLGQGSAYVKNPTVMTDAIANLLGDDLGSEYKQMTTGTSTASQGWGFGSCAWNNMPAVMVPGGQQKLISGFRFVA
ncbi:hypothetical protein Patl1_05757 [Pistacia atlantica]|uniref:Uncharacterized protein n=1 Tax=Pistacia atlantica TaxID=434234 RepID=A0ACC1BNQ4_9ROSI|nr:hypothetical protein Patl1_05757 [Pistacia atlantica]